MRDHDMRMETWAICGSRYSAASASSPRRGLPGRVGGQEDSKREVPRDGVWRRLLSAFRSKATTSNTSVLSSASSSPSAPRGAQLCEWSRQTTSVRELQQTTRRGCGQHWRTRQARHYCGDVKVVCPLSSSGEHGRKGAFVAFGNTEAFYRNMVVGHGPYCGEGER